MDNNKLEQIKEFEFKVTLKYRIIKYKLYAL